MGRLDEKHAFTASEVAIVVAELREEFFPAALHAEPIGGAHAT